MQVSKLSGLQTKEVENRQAITSSESLNRLIDTTKGSRDIVDRYLLNYDRDKEITLDIVTTVESLAISAGAEIGENGVVVEYKDPSPDPYKEKKDKKGKVLPRPDPSYKTEVLVSGTWKEVSTFYSLLEALPFVTVVEEIEMVYAESTPKDENEEIIMFWEMNARISMPVQRDKKAVEAKDK